jgi:hypothetical protein
MFNDVTSGSNPYQKCEGFQASPGWDPVTGMNLSFLQFIKYYYPYSFLVNLRVGLGTPIYPAMLKAAGL